MTGALLLLAACSMAPRYVRPEAPVPILWPVDPDEATGLPPWREQYTDPRLQALVQAALRQNRDLRIAILQVERARAQYRIQRADRLPTLSLEAGASWSGPLPEGGPVSSSYEVGGLVPGFELDLFGRVRSLSDAALARYLATEEGARSARISLVAAVAQAWLAECAAVEQLDLARRSLVARENSYRLDLQRFEAGIASEAELRQSETLVESTRVSVASLVRTTALAQHALLQLSDASLNDLPAPTPMAELHLPMTLPAGLPSEVLLERPDLRAAEQALRAAHADIGAARAAFFPRIQLTASAGTRSTELAGLFAAGTGAWAFAPGLSQPLFQMGALRAGLRVARVDREIAVARYQGAIQRAFREVADALEAREALDTQLAAQQRLRDAEARRAELALERYRAGVASHLELLDAERSLFDAERALIETRRIRLSNAVDLYAALGGGLD